MKKVNCKKFCEKVDDPENYWYHKFSEPIECEEYQDKYTSWDIDLVTGICESLEVCSC
ncbi:MAG: hypothetical protein ISS48_04060 [Candidatus Aenigmarchaeota archaeon]|nr:hypothetical protein [Candidatus Aenigmarchaeota archaeon]